MTKEIEIEETRKRFTSAVDLKREHITTIQDFLDRYQRWAGYHYKGTRRQKRFVVKIARREGIRGTLVMEELVFIRAKPRTIHRDIMTGRFIGRTGQTEAKAKTGRLSDAERARRVSLRGTQREAKTREYARKLAKGK